MDITERLDRGSSTVPASPDAGVAGNTRLTSISGMVLIVLLAGEGVTILSVRQLIAVHVFVGVLLIAPVLLKTASIGYRFVRYYTGSAPYVQKGPPHPVLRILGPVVIASSLAVLGTGVGLLAVTPGGPGLLLFAHKASFVVWAAVMTVHVLGHLREAVLSSWREFRVTKLVPMVRGGTGRLVLVAVVLAVGVAAAVIVMPVATPWTAR
ncbi:MAG: hypothetical protein QOG20_3031 [Pseudonocardiales bacterium]|nr:hypothetical protein [Pseudonocardiales bacterium]